jgi:FtsP/CotA-like multicopper oxidase with cupredoxin domain
LAPGKVIETFGFNGTAPGPVLRLPEGRRVSFEISNETDVGDMVHWHGSIAIDGSERRCGVVRRGSVTLGRRGYT